MCIEIMGKNDISQVIKDVTAASLAVTSGSRHVKCVSYQKTGTIFHMQRPTEQTVDIQYIFHKYRYTKHAAHWLRKTGGVLQMLSHSACC